MGQLCLSGEVESWNAICLPLSNNFDHFEFEYLVIVQSNMCHRFHYHTRITLRVFLIASVPGRHAGRNLDKWGHLKLRKVLLVKHFNFISLIDLYIDRSNSKFNPNYSFKILKRHGPSKDKVSGSWPAICQFSSIGSLGRSRDLWLYNEFRTSLSATTATKLTQLGERKADIKLVGILDVIIININIGFC